MHLSLWILIPLALFLVGSVISGRDAERRVAMLRSHIVDLEDKIHEHQRKEYKFQQRIESLETAEKDVKSALSRAVNKHYDREFYDVNEVVKSLDDEINRFYFWANR